MNAKACKERFFWGERKNKGKFFFSYIRIFKRERDTTLWLSILFIYFNGFFPSYGGMMLHETSCNPSTF